MHYVIFLSGSYLSQVVSTEEKGTVYHHTKMFFHPRGKDCYSPVSAGEIKLALNNEMEVEAICRGEG